MQQCRLIIASVTQEIPRHVPKRVHKIFYPEPHEFSQLPSTLFKINFNVIPSALRSSKWSFLLRIFYRVSLMISRLSHTGCKSRLSQPPRFHHPNNIS
jgi:hypothetical protein